MASLALAFDILARDRASKVFDNVGNSAERAGRKGKGFGPALKKGFGIAAAAGSVAVSGIVAGLGASINKAMDYDKTMRLVGATLGTTGKQQQALGALAVKMGADTVFSAGDASNAMLELAKGGMTAAQIQGGALAATMTLAAAGGLEMGNAATYVGNALNTFGLKAKDAGAVAAALAGGANASSASVESLGSALSQVGPGAKTAGLSIQETTAVLAAFDNAGIKGSDAGTSLKTMLTRLVPSTKAAREEMSRLGLKFTDSKGQFVSIANVAEQLRKKMGHLSDAERTRAMTTIFGSDATRAATVMMGLGAAGVQKYTKATSDQSAAQRMANTQMEGASGAWEAFKGSVETLAIQVGVKLLPAFTSIVKWLTQVTNAFSTKAGPSVQRFVNWVSGRLWPALKQGYQTIMPALRQALAIVTGGVDKGSVSWRKIGEVITQKVIPFVAKMISYYLPVLATNIRTAIEAVKVLYQVFQTWRSVVGTVISFILKRFADLSSMWAGVLRALGKVPGFGWATDAANKLDKAAGKADAVARAIDNIDRNVQINVGFRATAGRIRVGGESVNVGMRHSGGPMVAGRYYQVGDNPDGSWNRTTELMRAGSSARVINQEEARKALGSGGGKTDLSEPTLQRLAAILAGIRTNATVSVGTVDRAIVAGL